MSYIKYDRKNVKFLSVIAYLGPLFLIGKFSVEKENDTVKYHTHQGMVLFILELSYIFMAFIISILLSPLVVFKELIQVLFSVAGVVAFIMLSIMGSVSALKDKQVKLPIVSYFCKFSKDN